MSTLPTLCIMGKLELVKTLLQSAMKLFIVGDETFTVSDASSQ